MNIPVLQQSSRSPLVIVRRKPEALLVPKHIFRSAGYCTNCGRRYGWRIRPISPEMALSEEEFEQKERALSLWLQYRRKGWCDICIPQEYRTFITLTAGGAVYF